MNWTFRINADSLSLETLPTQPLFPASRAMRYRLNEPDVIQETVDGETLIVNTRTGTYYQVGGSGAQIWNALLARRTVEQTVDDFTADDSQRALIRSGVGGFIDALLTEHLILPTPDSQEAANTLQDPTGSSKSTFTTPELRKFTDMQELLLVDPIHEVDPAAGWPLPKDQQKAN